MLRPEENRKTRPRRAAPQERCHEAKFNHYIISKDRSAGPTSEHQPIYDLGLKKDQRRIRNASETCWYLYRH